jgi:hypothetical protein
MTSRRNLEAPTAKPVVSSGISISSCFCFLLQSEKCFSLSCQFVLMQLFPGVVMFGALVDVGFKMYA